MVAFGIDLGTAHARAAILVALRPVLVTGPDGPGGVPSLVCIDSRGGHPLVGRAAAERTALDPNSCLRGIAWYLGRSPTDAILGSDPSAFGPRLLRGGPELLVRAGDSDLAPTAVASLLIRHLAQLAARSTGVSPDAAVFTAPAWLGPSGRKALSDAAESAGLRVLQIIDGTVAAALSLLAARQAREQLVALVDIGAGGVSASVMSVGRTGIALLGNAGDGTAGGEMLSRALLAASLRRLAAHVPEGDDEGRTEMVRQAVEALKCELSSALSASAATPFLPGSPTLTLRRDEVTPLMAHLLRAIADVCARALKNAALPVDRLDVIAATGGMAQVPQVREAIARALGRTPSLIPSSSGALGAATFAGMWAGDLDAVPITDMSAPREGVEMAANSPAIGPVTSAPHVPAPAPSSPFRYSTSVAQPNKPAATEPPARAGGRYSAAMSSPPPPLGTRQESAAPTGRYSAATERPAAEPVPVREAPRVVPPPRPSSPGPPLPIGSGRFVCPANAASILDLPFTGALSADDLAPIALPILLVRLLGRSHVRGVLTLKHGKSSLSVGMLDGRACLTKVERHALTQAFLAREGTYSFEEKEVEVGLRSAHSMMRVTIDGFRVLGRTLSPEDMESALGDRLDRAPVLKAEAGRIVTRFGLGPGELRVLQQHFQGVLTGRAITRAGLGRHTTLLLLLWLTMFDTLEWGVPREVGGGSSADE